MSETFIPKCYVMKCLVCGALDMAARSDKATCSPACRVRAHRTGLLKRVRTEIAGSPCPEITPAWMARMNAVIELCPALVPRIRTGDVGMDDPEARLAVHQAFMELLEAEIEQRAQA